MEAFLNILNNNIIYIIIAMAVLLIGLTVICVTTFVRLSRLNKRYNFFMGSNSRPSDNLETRLIEYIGDVKELKTKYSRMLKLTEDIDKNLERSIQKVGVIRYNPFDEVGGNLCFSVALLDEKNDGVVITGIHSRTGSFTYAKPVEMGVSPYVLSEEEMTAINKAKDSQYKGIDREMALQKVNGKILRVKIRPKRPKKAIYEHKPEEEEMQQIRLDEFVEDIGNEESDFSADEKKQEKNINVTLDNEPAEEITEDGSEKSDTADEEKISEPEEAADGSPSEDTLCQPKEGTVLSTGSDHIIKEKDSPVTDVKE